MVCLVIQSSYDEENEKERESKHVSTAQDLFAEPSFDLVRWETLRVIFFRKIKFNMLVLKLLYTNHNWFLRKI